MKPWDQVTIVGVGLIGGSLGLALRKARLARRVVGVGRRQASLEAARRRQAADETTLDAAAGARGSDLVVLATPVGRFHDRLLEMAPVLRPGAVVIDVGSTKAQVVADLEPLVPEGRTFLGCHPVAGSEQRGVEAARADLFQGNLCILTPTPRTPPDVLERVTATWTGVGMTVRLLSPADHDRLLAEVSHLVHVAAAALVTAISAEAEPLVGPGWVDTTRVAGGDPALWRDILLTNAAELAKALRKAEGVLDEFRRALEAGDAPRIQDLLAAAQARRRRLLEARDEGRSPPARAPEPGGCAASPSGKGRSRP